MWPDKWINWALIGNPANWFVVFLMLAIFMMLVTVIHASYGGGSQN